VGTEENLYPRISESLTQVGAKFPECLSRDFVRILQRIELLWGEKEAIGYLDSLFLEDLPDDKENLSLRSEHHTTRTRQGFPIEVVTEIVLLKQVHQLLFPSTSLNPYDPFSGSEIVPIEQTAKVDTHSESVSAGEASNDSAAVHSGSANTGKKHQIDWPVIRTPHELTEIAKLQRKGENIYPLQGKPVGEILLHYGVIDENTLRVVRDMQKRPSHKNRPLGEILVEVGIIKQDELTHTLLIQAGIPMVDLFTIDIPPEITKSIQNAKAREKLAVPIGSYQDTLYLAVADPFTFKDQSFFTIMTGMKVNLVFAPKHEIINRLNIHGFAKGGVAKKSIGAAKEEFRNLARRDMDTLLDQPLDEDIVTSDVSENDSTIVNLVNQMIINAIEEEASDIHIELFNDGKEARIRFRRDGNMEHFSDYPRTYHKAVVSRIKIMSGLDISEKRRPQDGKISFSIPHGKRVDLRVATIPAMLGVEFVTIRILASGEPLPLGKLGMANHDINVFRETFQRPYGLILVCGPTGSGKTTTLHSVLNELNTEDRKIWTAEDPVEIVQPHLCQVQVNSKIGMTFAAVLRSFLRADPDVIMIGEMRDHETAQIALEASMTGHLVLSTLHTNSASETVARLLDLGIDPYNLSDALLAILAQRLARKLCTICARRDEPSISEIEALANEYYQSAHLKPPTLEERNDIIQGWRKNFGVDGKLYLMHPVGCEMCSGGYKGRIGLYELLQATPSLRHLIRQRSAASEYMETGIANGMRTLKQDGIEKVLRGITDMMQVHGACI
jgi:type II secretory ATPase GspE/PulE/Tfp pilus assembly ATPase PilB-like protein